MKLIIISLFVLLGLYNNTSNPSVTIFYKSFYSIDEDRKDRNYFINSDYGRVKNIILEDPALSSSIILYLEKLENSKSLKDSVDNYYLRGVCLVSYDSQYDTLEIFTKFSGKNNEFIKYKNKTYQNEISNELFKKIAINISYIDYLHYLENKKYYDSLENEINRR